jgi:hypothetical protein
MRNSVHSVAASVSEWRSYHSLTLAATCLTRKFHPPSEDEEQTVIWGWGALAPVAEQNGARAPHPMKYSE